MYQEAEGRRDPPGEEKQWQRGVGGWPCNAVSKHHTMKATEPTSHSVHCRLTGTSRDGAPAPTSRGEAGGRFQQDQNREPPTFVSKEETKTRENTHVWV